MSGQVIDWTVYALDRFAAQCYKKGDYAEAELVFNTIQLYDDGFIDVSWTDGNPLFKLTPEAKIIMDVMKETPEADAVSDIKNLAEKSHDSE